MKYKLLWIVLLVVIIGCSSSVDVVPDRVIVPTQTPNIDEQQRAADAYFRAGVMSAIQAHFDYCNSLPDSRTIEFHFMGVDEWEAAARRKWLHCSPPSETNNVHSPRE